MDGVTNEADEINSKISQPISALLSSEKLYTGFTNPIFPEICWNLAEMFFFSFPFSKLSWSFLGDYYWLMSLVSQVIDIFYSLIGLNHQILSIKVNFHLSSFFVPFKSTLFFNTSSWFQYFIVYFCLHPIQKM